MGEADQMGARYPQAEIQRKKMLQESEELLHARERLMSAVGFSIEPREEDREEAMKIVLTELIGKTTQDDITEYLIRKQQVIIQAERLRDQVIKYYDMNIKDLEEDASVPDSTILGKARGM